MVRAVVACLPREAGGRSMATRLGPLERLLAAGAEVGAFAVDDPAFTASRLYTQVRG